MMNIKIFLIKSTALILSIGGLMLIVFLQARPIQAALELNYFRIVSTFSSIELQWGTLEEYNVEGFEIFCKDDGAPDYEYHSIGTKTATGSPTDAADYSFLVPLTGIEVGKSHCFKIQELTIEGSEPGDIFEFCGYGLGVTPTPAPGAVTSTPFPTVLHTLTPTETITPTYTFTPTPIDTPTLTLTQTEGTRIASTDPALLEPIARLTLLAEQAVISGTFTVTPTDTPTHTPTRTDTATPTDLPEQDEPTLVMRIFLPFIGK